MRECNTGLHVAKFLLGMEVRTSLAGAEAKTAAGTRPRKKCLGGFTGLEITKTETPFKSDPAHVLLDLNLLESRDHVYEVNRKAGLEPPYGNVDVQAEKVKPHHCQLSSPPWLQLN